MVFGPRYNILLASHELVRRTIKSMSTAVTPDYIQSTLLKIIQLEHRYGFVDGGFKEITPGSVIVEYSSPNIAKEFHVGHFRSTVIGQAISNIIESAGNKVTRINYLGDWGMQFAVLAVGFEKYGDYKLLENSALKHLLNVYIKANVDLEKNSDMKSQAQDIFCKMESGDSDSLKFWELCRKLSIEEYRQLYDSINVVFDSYESESMYYRQAQDITMNLRKKNSLSQLDNGSESVELSHTSWHRDSSNGSNSVAVPLARSNGTSLYLSRDVAAAISRCEKYDFDQMIYVVDKNQADHFKQVFGVLEYLGYEWANRDYHKLEHVSFGRVKGMKTRKGEVIFLEDLLSEACDLASKERLGHSTSRKNISDQSNVDSTLGLSGLVCAELKPKLSKDHSFSWSTALQSKGDTGIFLQYTHCRMQNLKKNCGVRLDPNVNCSTLINDTAAIDLFLHLMKMTDAAWLAYSNLEPSHLTKYTFQLAHFIARAHRQLKVMGQPDDVAQPRLLLFHCAQIVLHTCMKTIGLQPLDEM